MGRMVKAAMSKMKPKLKGVGQANALTGAMNTTAAGVARPPASPAVQAVKKVRRSPTRIMTRGWL